MHKRPVARLCPRRDTGDDEDPRSDEDRENVTAASHPEHGDRIRWPPLQIAFSASRPTNDGPQSDREIISTQ
ncbi:MAG: hypothetical protein WKF48_13840 [Solirubrobacteraceae bacterium]